jgi:hypothetical protein
MSISKNRRLIVLGFASLFALGIGSAYLIGRARAAGAPTLQPLTYTGTLTDTAGVPLTGSKNLQLTLWDMATAGTMACTFGPSTVTLSAGTFQVVLPADCSTAIHAHGDLWLEVFVDGASLGRTKLGAVPYALEADHAVNADQSVSGFQVPGTLTAQSAQVSGNVSIGGILVRKIARAHGVGPNDDTDTGAIVSRTLAFTKTQEATGIRVGYSDNFRAFSASGVGACRWEIRFNGTSCTVPIINDLYVGGIPNQSAHRMGSVFGTCFGLPAGNYNVQVYVGPQPAGLQVQADCYTGWYLQYWSIEAEEVL